MRWFFLHVHGVWAHTGTVDRNLALEVVRVTEAAALAAARFVGRGDREGADRAATEAMRKTFGFGRPRGRGGAGGHGGDAEDFRLRAPAGAGGHRRRGARRGADALHRGAGRGWRQRR